MKKRRLSILLFFLVSIILHGIALIFLPDPLPTLSHQPKSNELAVELISPIEKRLLFDDDKDHKQIVDLVDDEKTVHKIPEKADYRSDKNRSVNIETKARVSTNIPSLPGKQQLNDIVSMPMDDIQQNTNEDDNEEKSSVESGDKPAKKRHLDLMPSAALLSRFTVPYDSNYTKVENEGDVTLLNTKEFLYGSYYARIRQLISYNWRPQPAWDQINTRMREKPPALIISQIEVILDRKGYLVEAKLMKSSGYEIWDHEAIRAINAAAPFLNPPEMLIESDGNIHFPFSFIMEISYSFFNKLIQ